MVACPVRITAVTKMAVLVIREFVFVGCGA
jgi:hypothetical protein